VRRSNKNGRRKLSSEFSVTATRIGAAAWESACLCYQGYLMGRRGWRRVDREPDQPNISSAPADGQILVRLSHPRSSCPRPHMPWPARPHRQLRIGVCAGPPCGIQASMTLPDRCSLDAQDGESPTTTRTPHAPVYRRLPPPSSPSARRASLA
jgi:hypothetical protein